MNEIKNSGLCEKRSLLSCFVRTAPSIGIYLAFVLILAGSARAEWSPEIVLWELQEDINPGPTGAAIAIDPYDNVHILYSYKYSHPSYPNYWPIGLMYVKFDNRGNQLVWGTLLNDSFDVSAEEPEIRFFGNDSLWIVWGAYRPRTSWYGFQQRTLDLNGNVLSEIREWPERRNGIMSAHAFDVSRDRLAVAVYADTNEVLRCVVQRPDGSRIMDHTVIWDQPVCDLPNGFVDTADSLQIAWRQRGYWWDAIFAKRVDIRRSFDPMQLSSHVSLTPVQPDIYYSFPRFLPTTDSLLVMTYYGPPGFCTAYLRVMNRADYVTVADIRLGRCAAWIGYPVGMEGDSALNACVFPSRDDRQVHFRRFHYPTLAIIDDVVLARFPEDETFALRDYAVSRSGIRHLVFSRQIGPHRQQIIYRYWPNNPAPDARTMERTEPLFVVRPNPATADLTIDGPFGLVQTVAIYNILGQEVLARRPPRGERLILSASELRPLPAGTYFLYLRTPAETVVRKFVITR